jgi:hypothetical protein
LSTTAAESIIRKAEEVFSGIERPEHFTNHTHCCECRDHDDELQPFTPATIPRSALGHMGWDPITFCTDQGFRYFLPGMIRIVLTETGEDNYFEQFMWHVSAIAEGHDRYKVCTPAERAVVAMTLNWLLEHRSEEIEQEMVAQDLLSAIERWSDVSAETSLR